MTPAQVAEAQKLAREWKPGCKTISFEQLNAPAGAATGPAAQARSGARAVRPVPRSQASGGGRIAPPG
jgi:hypothetical protein